MEGRHDCQNAGLNEFFTFKLKFFYLPTEVDIK